MQMAVFKCFMFEIETRQSCSERGSAIQILPALKLWKRAKAVVEVMQHVRKLHATVRIVLVVGVVKA